MPGKGSLSGFMSGQPDFLFGEQKIVSRSFWVKKYVQDILADQIFTIKNPTVVHMF